MNATKWPSLTEFAKHLGREGVCRVEETDKGIQVAWIDDSPDALRRKEAVRRKEMQDKGDEEREQRMIREQIRRAKKGAAGREENDDDDGEDVATKKPIRQEGEPLKLSFGLKPVVQIETATSAPQVAPQTSNSTDNEEKLADLEKATEPVVASASNIKATPVSMKMAVKPVTKNVFAAAKKNALASGPKKASVFGQPKKMSEAERIMREEQEKKRSRESPGLGELSNKRRRT